MVIPSNVVKFVIEPPVIATESASWVAILPSPNVVRAAAAFPAVRKVFVKAVNAFSLNGKRNQKESKYQKD